MKDRYDYARLCADLARLEKSCPYIRRGSIGKSLYGRDLHRVTIGRGKKQVFYNGAHHGMEGMTARLLVRFAEECCAALEQDGKLGGIQASKLFDDIRLEIVPMINPDGVEISVHGVRREDARYGRLVRLNGGEDFTRWQANGRGVDLNHNYNALWETCRETERAIGITGPGPTRYGGSAPESEPESRAAANFTRANDFALAIAFHSQGQVIYYDFNGEVPPGGRELADAFAAVSPYKPDKPEHAASCGGYKDWFIQTYHRPAFTVEIGLGENPLPPEQFEQIYRETLPLLLLGCTFAQAENSAGM